MNGVVGAAAAAAMRGQAHHGDRGGETAEDSAAREHARAAESYEHRGPFGRTVRTDGGDR